jgi:cell division protein FtsZ
MDPEMSDELRVTVVATGIGQERKPDITLVAGNQKQQPVTPAVAESKPQPKPEPAKALNPSIETPVPSDNANVVPKQKAEQDYLDIPAFLRKQAD